MIDPSRSLRRWLPAELAITGWADVVDPARDLRERSLSDAASLVRWLEDWSELDAALDERHTRLYVARTQDTRDEDAARRLREYERDVFPPWKALGRDLARRFLACEARRELDATRHAVLDRSLTAEEALYREENVALELEDSELSQTYQQISGRWTVTFRGAERTAQQMGVFLEDRDRATRAEAFEALARRRLEDAEELDALYDRMVDLRTRIARGAGFATYQDYAFPRLGRFDYAPADCARWAAAIEAVVVPRVRALHERRRLRLGVATLEPYDLGFDPFGGEALRPFSGARALVDAVTRVFEAVDPELAEQFRGIDRSGCLDLESRPGKAPGGYQATHQESRTPFLFTNAVGLHRDVQTLLHEGGHAFHTLACRDEPLVRYRQPPLEFAEVASMGMELLAEPHLGRIYGAPRDVLRARLQNRTTILTLLPWIACIDGFQRWVYQHPGHGRAERRAHWLTLHERYAGGESWERFPGVRASLWQRQNHVFTAPFYYVEYALAQVGALQLARAARRDPSQTLRRYRTALALGGSRPLPELFRAAGLSFGVEREVLEPLVDELYGEIVDIETRLSAGDVETRSEPVGPDSRKDASSESSRNA